MERYYEGRTITDILHDCTTALEQEAPTRWKFSLRNGIELSGTAYHDDDWLTLTTAPAGASAPAVGALDLLSLNGGLPGGVKFARAGNPATLLVLGEVALDPHVDLQRRVHEMCDGLKAAMEAYAIMLGRYGSSPAPLVLDEPPRAANATGSDQAAMLQLCTEAGWQGNARGDDRAVVELDVPGTFRQAVLSAAGAGLRITTVLADCAAPRTDACRSALGVLLLRTSGVVRMARAAVDMTPDRAVPRFEVCFDSGPGPAELARALAALSIACRFSADEAAAVHQDDRLARIYLAAVEPGSARANERGRRPRRQKARPSNATASQAPRGPKAP